ncbi:putative short-chain dehydrogenase reductase family [Diaporthe ampelina]|uniref:AP-1 complex subunit sigma-1 n=1 Tax=Diaporthe ampelina TaxID=1214573 RepID=A0A0G2HGR9_9PEZI|nr:putative short-chain dehydrogenase reductase family [Diaporthe ampelina]
MVMLRLTAEQYRKLPILADESTCSGKTYIITGGNSGLGLETARHIVEFNASRVILAVRNLTAGEDAKKDIEKTTGHTGVVESFADKVSAQVDRIDGFVANAGVLLDSWSTVEGMETSIQVNVVNTLLLGTLILPKMSAIARQLGIQPTLVFIVSVLGYIAKGEMDKSRDGGIFEGLNNQKKANMNSRYALSKLVEELAVRQLSAAAPVERTGVIVNMVAPGLCHSGLGRETGSWTKAMLSAVKAMMARTAEEGSRTILHGLVAGPESHGKLLSGCKVKEFWAPGWQIFVRTVISGDDNVRSLREFQAVDSFPTSPSDGIAIMAINYLILLSRQGKVRLAKWFQTMSPKEKAKIVKDVSQLVLARRTRMCNFLEYKDTKIVYRRYASLFFIAGASSDDNELITLEVIHRYVEQMDKYYGNVCELDIIFSFTKAYWILDELLLAGELQESSKKTVLRCIAQQDSLEDMEVS